MKNKFSLIFLVALTPLAAADSAEDVGKLYSGKTGIDIRIGINQASTGGIFHLSSWLAFNPNVIYRSEETTNNYMYDPASGNSPTFNTYKESYFGVGGYIPIYVARVENLHIRLLPGFSYLGGKFNRSQIVGSSTNYDQTG